MIKLVIFDLDDTLVNTSTFKEKRDNKEWKELSLYLNSFEVISNADKVVKYLKDSNITIVIMTKSPENYAIQILKSFNIEYDELYAYQDLINIKQTFHAIKTDAICKVKKDYKLMSHEILFIGDSVDDYKSCEETNIMFLTHPQSQAAIDFNTNLYILNTYEELKDIIAHPLLNDEIKIHNELSNGGYKYTSFSNYISNSYQDLPYNGSSFFVSYDAMHKRIKELKENNIFNITKWLIFLENIDWKNLFPDVDCITRTLSSNELRIDINCIKPLDIIGNFIADKLSCEYKVDILTQSQTRDKLSESKCGYEGRKKLLYGIINSKPIKEIQKILLLDDIITTGATTEVSIDSIKYHNPHIDILICSIAHTVAFSDTNYLDNINNLKYFPCTKIDNKSLSICNTYLIMYLLTNLDKNKYFTSTNNGYIAGVIKIKGINIFGKINDYLYFSVKQNDAKDNVIYESMYIDYFDIIENITRTNYHKNKFINKAIEYLNQNNI